MKHKIFRILIVLGLCIGFIPAAESQAAVTWDPFFAAPTTIANLGAATRPYGIAAGDFDEDGHVDIFAGRTTGNVHFIKGNGDGTFQAATQYAWKQAYFNVWSLAAGDLNADGNLDVIWCATADSSSTSGIVVYDGEVRVFYGNGDGTFQENTYLVSGITHNAGTLVADIGTDAGALSVGDVDGDGDLDIIVGGVDTNFYVKLIRQGPIGTFIVENIINMPYTTVLTAPIYYPPLNPIVSPWGIALGDVDYDGDLDLFICDRALYVYYYNNDGSGNYTLVPGNKLADRGNVYLLHDSYRAALGNTGALAAGDLNGDDKADLAMGLQIGGHATALVHDGEILLDLSSGAGFAQMGAVGDIGMIARGVTLIDVNEDGYLDIVSGEYGGTIKLLRQLPPLDTDGDGISDYLDNAPVIANAPRLDMNTDSSKNYHDQLDNDFDTVLGNPEDSATWFRLGDPADDDDDNDKVSDEFDNCLYTYNSDQADQDLDGVGDACDPLDDTDMDGDGWVDGPMPGDPYYKEALAAKIKMSQGSTYFIIRIDALSRFFQNEFTQIMTDAGILSEADWAVKCWENYDPDDFEPDYEPCGTGEGTVDQTLTLEGGKQVPISLVVIPKQVWTDPPVVTWINDRNQYIELEIAQHGTYHINNTPYGDWGTDSTKNFYACETCGLSESENYEFLKVGYDTLVGDYTNKWVAESGATESSPKIDWATSANPLISYAPPYNASDTLSRFATAQLGYKSFSASKYEEEAAYLGGVFSPEGSHMEQFDQFGMFHASADLQVNPPLTPGDQYDEADYIAYLNSITEVGGLNTWLIEEVEWSGRPNNHAPRDEGNRENNTVYLPRWQAWMTLLEFVRDYSDGVALTLGEVALAKAYDNAPTVSNPGQEDLNQNGIGDVIEGVTLQSTGMTLVRNTPGLLSATLKTAAAESLAGQLVSFHFDSNCDATNEIYTATTDVLGVAKVNVTATCAVGDYSVGIMWDGLREITATTVGNVKVMDQPQLTLEATNPTSGLINSLLSFGATLQDSDGLALAGQTITFTLGSDVQTATTDGTGYAEVDLTINGLEGPVNFTAEFDETTYYLEADDQAFIEVIYLKQFLPVILR